MGWIVVTLNQEGKNKRIQEKQGHNLPPNAVPFLVSVLSGFLLYFLEELPRPFVRSHAGCFFLEIERVCPLVRASLEPTWGIQPEMGWIVVTLNQEGRNKRNQEKQGHNVLPNTLPFLNPDLSGFLLYFLEKLPRPFQKPGWVFLSRNRAGLPPGSRLS